jgi:hypothetical protein
VYPAAGGAALSAYNRPPMPAMTSDQKRTRTRAEALISLMAPALDLVLAAGSALSRVVDGPHDPEPLAVHPPDYQTPRLGPGTR